MLPNSNFFLNLLWAILVPLKSMRFFQGIKYGHNFTQKWHEAERMELNRCSVKQLEEEEKANLLYIFQSIKVKYEMQATKGESNPWKGDISFTRMLYWAQLTKYGISVIIYSPICKWVSKYIANIDSITDSLYWWQINEAPSWNELQGTISMGFQYAKHFTRGKSILWWYVQQVLVHHSVTFHVTCSWLRQTIHLLCTSCSRFVCETAKKVHAMKHSWQTIHFYFLNK